MTSGESAAGESWLKGSQVDATGEVGVPDLEELLGRAISLESDGAGDTDDSVEGVDGTK